MINYYRCYYQYQHRLMFINDDHRWFTYFLFIIARIFRVIWGITVIPLYNAVSLDEKFHVKVPRCTGGPRYSYTGDLLNCELTWQSQIMAVRRTLSNRWHVLTVDKHVKDYCAILPNSRLKTGGQSSAWVRRGSHVRHSSPQCPPANFLADFMRTHKVRQSPQRIQTDLIGSAINSWTVRQKVSADVRQCPPK